MSKKKRTAAYNSIDLTYYQRFNAAGAFKIGIGFVIRDLYLKINEKKKINLSESSILVRAVQYTL